MPPFNKCTNMKSLYNTTQREKFYVMTCNILFCFLFEMSVSSLTLTGTCSVFLLHSQKEKNINKIRIRDIKSESFDPTITTLFHKSSHEIMCSTLMVQKLERLRTCLRVICVLRCLHELLIAKSATFAGFCKS